jgi:adenylate cyclase
MSTEPVPEIMPPVPAGMQGVPVPSHSRWRRSWQPLRSRFGRQFAIAAVALGGLAAAGHFVGGFIGWWHLYEVTMHAGKPVLQASTTDAKSRKLPRLSIVVLPLTIEGSAQDGDWFTDVLSGDLTHEIGKFSGALVISRDTAFTYKGKAVDPREVSRELRVRYVVRGTVRRDGERVRLNLAMVDGESGTQHWSQQFDMERAKLAKALDEVVLQVGRSLSVQLYRSEGQRAAALKPEEMQADDLAMQGWSAMYRGLSRENLLEAQKLFEAAVAQDPKAVRAWGGIAYVYYVGVSTGWFPDREAAIRRVQFASDRLQVLDENDLMALVGRSNAAGITGDYEGQLRSATAFIERFPNNPNAHFNKGFALMNLGRFQECIEPAKQSIRLGPRDSGLGGWYMQIAACHFMRGEYGHAAERARDGVQANPNLPLPRLILAASLARQGRIEEGRAEVAAFRQRNPAYTAEFIGKVLSGNNPQFAEGRGRLQTTLRELGLP